ncbi:S-adenosyl-L-methionine-dependent methyltransferase [Xylona heveae TC161]|uniref:S-adenosyl-L-methionine-dependent methyltransferase n=1 Tax=Xylona heveae (strain CBS 132557 / TC161) TaxID=1328760 RepID=A0A161TEK8_XYLHT|nr:S-adenosyl-L-methionine-dependent methyltransferase [Xylona heveae TC161]KZF24377.1 S-adenosyl-L-methionine-dependent methyltransferase [Xylona heveae TC161]
MSAEANQLKRLSRSPSSKPASSFIEADSHDSGNEEDGLSLTSSMYNFPMENGRRYHRYREGAYVYPNDEPELERLNLQHFILQQAFGGRSYFAPLRNPKRMLDIGTGTGVWPLEMAEEFPDCEIIGTDLSPIQPQMVAENVHFFIDDAAEEDWLYPPNHFDYIHTRAMAGSFEDFRHIIRQAFFYLKPGAWLESQEIMSKVYCDDGTMPDTWPFVTWSRDLDDAAIRNDRPIRIANKLKRWYEEAGFVDVHEEVFKVAANPWPKDEHMKRLGRLSMRNILEGLQGLSMATFHRALGWTKEEVEVYLVEVRKALQDRSVHAYHKIFVVWGRKPEDVVSQPRPKPS